MKIIQILFSFIGQIFDELLKINEFIAFLARNLFPVYFKKDGVQELFFIKAFEEVIKDEENFQLEDLDEIRQLYNSLYRLQNKPIEKAFEVISQFLKNHLEVRDNVLYLARRYQTRQIESSDFRSFNPKDEGRILRNSFPRLLPELNQIIERLDKKWNDKLSN